MDSITSTTSDMSFKTAYGEEKPGITKWFSNLSVKSEEAKKNINLENENEGSLSNRYHLSLPKNCRIYVIFFFKSELSSCHICTFFKIKCSVIMSPFYTYKNIQQQKPG